MALLADEYVYETIKLQQDEEYRIYLSPKEWIRIWLIGGSAEIFGTELREAKRNEKYNSNGHSYSNSRSHYGRGSRRKDRASKKNANKMDDIKNHLQDTEEVYSLSDSYLFSNTNISIYSYNVSGCRLYIKYLRGQCEHKFSTKDTPYITYCNYNAALTNMRRSAEVHQTQLALENKLSETPKLPKIAADVIANDFSLNEHKILDLEIMKSISSYGPRVLVLGPPNSGKASLSKILSNYGLRSGYYPLLVDLDCSINMISIPGTIAAVSICEPIDVCNGFNHSHSANVGSKKQQMNHNKTNEAKENAINDDDDVIKEEQQFNPIIYFYGDDHPDRRLKVYEKCVEKLSLVIKKKLIVNLKSRAAGIIVKCHGCCNNPSDAMKSVINNVIKLFHIDTILCIDDELTLNYLRTKYKNNIDSNNYYAYLMNKMDLSSYWKNRFIAIEKAVKSGGVVVREQAERLAIGRNIISNYFYGNNNNYRPLSCETYPAFLRIYQIGSGQTQNDLLPADQRSVVESFGVLPVRFDSSLRGQILAVLQIENGCIENEQYQIERDINTLTMQSGNSNINVNQILMSLIEFDDDNENVMYNHNTQTQISIDPFKGDAKLKNKLIRSSNVMGFVHVQEVKFDPHQRGIPKK
eukprot:544221_1